MKGIWTSRKFYALLAATIGIIGSVMAKEVTWVQAMNAEMVAIGAYIVGTGIASTAGK